MFWVYSIGDLPAIKNLGCDGVHHPFFDGIIPEEQAAWMSECSRLGLQIGWSALGGSDYAHQNREATIKRWKDSPLVSHVILVGDAQGVPGQTQIDKYNLFKSWAPNISFAIDREFWFERNGNFSENAFDILFFYSYCYQRGTSVDDVYRYILNSMNYLIKGTYPIIPLIQCFSSSKTYNPRERFKPGDPEYSENYMKAQYDRQKALLQPKGWWSDSIGFYPWSAGYDTDVKRSPIMQAEVKELNTGEAPPPFPCPYCPATFTTQAELDAHIASEHPSGEELDVGDSCIDRNSFTSANYTYINKGNPANATGRLKNVCLYVRRTNGLTTKIGVFYVVSGDILKCRSVHNAGTIPTGKQNVLVDMEIHKGDYIGIFSGENIMYSTDTGAGMWGAGPGGDGCIVGKQLNYLLYTRRAISVYGTGISTAEIISDKTILHTCNVKISYKVSSFPENNDPLTCPNCGMALGVEGIRGSEEIIEEEITTHIITCAKCGSQLKLTISVSIPEKNTEQYCPVCGEPAD